jgi:hypothetical protein
VTERTAELRIVEDLWRQLSAVDPALYRRANRSIRRRRTMRTLALALLALLGLAGAAVAAKTLLFGESVARRYPLNPRVTQSVTGRERLLSLRAVDPQGGPVWAMRIFTPETSQSLCAQVGRVVSGQLVALGTNGAFHNDHLAHPLPLEAQGCGGTDAHGHPTLTFSPDIFDTSAVLFPRHCLDPQTRRLHEDSAQGLQLLVARLRRSGPASRLQEAERRYRQARELVVHPPPPCDPATLRTIFAGFVGPAGGTVSLVDSGGRRHVVVARRRDHGAYLFVLNGQLDGSTMTFSVQYPNGTTCVLPNPWWGPEETQRHAQSAELTRRCLQASGYRPRPAKLR